MHPRSSHSHRSRRAFVTAAAALLFTLAACSGPGGAQPQPSESALAGATVAPASPAPSALASGPTAASDDPEAIAAGVVLTQAWATEALTDVRTGESFRIADLVADDRVVFIETMAIWCSSCRTQQRDVVKALAALDPGRVTWIGVDVDASEKAGDLANYSLKLGFDWPYVVASTDLARALAAEFGDQVLSPPSTPIIVVGTDGTVTLTEFGHKSVDRILELAAAHGA